MCRGRHAMGNPLTNLKRGEVDMSFGKLLLLVNLTFFPNDTSLPHLSLHNKLSSTAELPYDYGVGILSFRFNIEGSNSL